jgi:hypothetical protein
MDMEYDNSKALLLVCARADKSDKCVRGSSFHERCQCCRDRVLISPAKQKLREENPDAPLHIVCEFCAAHLVFPLMFKLGYGIEEVHTPAPHPDEVIHNPWRTRN